MPVTFKNEDGSARNTPRVFSEPGASNQQIADFWNTAVERYGSREAALSVAKSNAESDPDFWRPIIDLYDVLSDGTFSNPVLVSIDGLESA